MTPLKSTDTAALNAAFAEKVAGFVWVNNWVNSGRFLKHPDVEFMHNPVDMSLKPCDDFDRLIPDFCHSADAVLPWLEKWKAPENAPSKGWIAIWSPENPKGAWTVYRSFFPPTYAATLPLAIVIALLRSKGIQVEDGE